MLQGYCYKYRIFIVHGIYRNIVSFQHTAQECRQVLFECNPSHEILLKYHVKGSIILPKMSITDCYSL